MANYIRKVYKPLRFASEETREKLRGAIGWRSHDWLPDMKKGLREAGYAELADTVVAEVHGTIERLGIDVRHENAKMFDAEALERRIERNEEEYYRKHKREMYWHNS